MELRLTILGEPMGKQRPYATTNIGFTRTFTPQKTLNYENKVISAYKEQYSGKIFDPHQELYATIVAYFPITKQHYRFHKKTNSVDLDKVGEQMKLGKVNPIKKPDCDNIAKICLDALNDIAYNDDSQVVCLLVLKKYSETPRVEITIESGKEIR